MRHRSIGLYRCKIINLETYQDSKGKKTLAAAKNENQFKTQLMFLLISVQESKYELCI